MGKYTPGPWKAVHDWPFDNTSPDAVVVESLNGTEALLCEFTHSVFRDAQKANARLIAAAPQMYELLAHYVELGPDPGGFWDEASKLLREIDNE